MQVEEGRISDGYEAYSSKIVERLFRELRLPGCLGTHRRVLAASLPGNARSKVA